MHSKRNETEDRNLSSFRPESSRMMLSDYSRSLSVAFPPRDENDSGI